MYHIKPKKYIKDKELLSNFECNICFELSEKPQMCQGPCHMILCPCCIGSIQKNIGGCPQRCSKPLKTEQIRGLAIQFDCPWNKELCKEGLKTPEQFEDHLSKCEYVNQKWKEVTYNMNHYLCGKGHSMVFLDENLLREFYGYNFYEKATSSVCAHCEEVGLCRTICPTCSTKENLVLFCTKCSKPPCIKTSCPYSHAFRQEIASFYSNICDMCGKPSRMFGLNVYRDNACNFDICQICYENLPNQHPLVPFKRDGNMLAHLLPKRQHQPHQNIYGFLQYNNNLPQQFLVLQNHDDSDEDSNQIQNQQLQQLQNPVLIENQENINIQESDDQEPEINNDEPAEN